MFRPVVIETSRVKRGTIAEQKLKVSTNATRGRRPYMEDMVVAQFGRDDGVLCNTLFVGVFDGHGGSRVAEFCKDEFTTFIEQNLREHGKAVEIDPEVLEAAIHDSFLDLDDKIEGLAPVLIEGKSTLPCLPKGEDYYKDIDHVGSTATTVLVCPKKLVFANCGDSRAILIRDEQVVFVTTDHVPEDPAETTRVEHAGGFVQGNRIDGVLGVARALGDHRFKSNESLPPEQQEVCAVPETTSIDRAEGDQFIVLASDGLWGVMSNEKARDMVLDFVVKRRLSLEEACEALVKTACNSLLSGDNVSVAIVDVRS